MDKRGFTLIELLLAMTLFAVASASSYGVFSMGIQIWRRTQAAGQAEHKALIALEKMGSDVRQMIKTEVKDSLMTETFEYKGGTASLSVPGSVQFKGGDKENRVQTGRITYTWDLAKKRICRAAESATDLYQKRTPVCKTLVEGIPSFKIRYWMYDSTAKSYSWYDEWDMEDGAPSAVRVEMELQSKLSTALKKFTRTFLVPVAQSAESFGVTVESPAA
jgi:type II secretion system protein J